MAYQSFDSIFGTNTTTFLFNDPMVQKILLSTVIFVFVSVLLVEKLTTIARKWGTIEFY